MAFQKITGTITLDNQVSGSHNLLGLRIDLLLPSSRNPEEGTWIGSSRIDETGFFEVMYVADQMLTTTITYQIYNGVYLIEKGTRPVSGALQISVKQEVYDHSIPDDTRKKVHIDYAVIQGSIILASGVPAVPVEESEVIVTIKKLKFRDAIVLTGTSIDRFGRYEIKLPYSALYPKAQFEYNSVPQVIIEIEADETVIASSQPVTLSENYITADIVIPDPDDYLHFISEYETILSHIHGITGLSDSEMATITTEGEQPEINTVVTTSGIDFESVNNIIMSSEIAADTGAEMHHLYAIIRAGNNNLGAMSSIEPSVIQEIIENGIEGHIIPSSGNIQTTIELLNNYKIKTELEDTNDDDTSLEIILESILGNGTLANEFMAIHERMQLLSVEELWTEVETEMGSIHSQKLQQGFQMIAVVGLQAEMIQSLFSLQTPFPDYIAQSDTATIQSLVQQVCVTHQKLCVPRSIRGHVPVQDYNNTAVHEAYAKKITAIGKELFASGVIIEALANDQQFSAQFSDPLDVSLFLSQNREFDFRVTNIWETSLNITDQLRTDMMPLQNLTRLTSGKVDLVVSLMKNGIRTSHQVAELSETQFKDILGQVVYEPSVVSSIYKKAIQVDFQVKNTYIQLFPGNYTEKVTINYSQNIWNNQQQPQQGFPDLEALFGSMDFCTCSDCTSMYSPSAYFTDLFNFIKTRLGSSLAYNELTRRRPDLPHIDISCKNANTALPYIDLVNELLELIILREIKANDPGESELFIPLSFQTRATAQELVAYPEHVYKDVDGSYKDYFHYVKVYDNRLSKAIYPNTLPFHLALEESRVFLKHMDRSRYELMDLYTPKGYTSDTDTSRINEYNQAAEWLGISRITADIITKNAHPELTEELWAYYGFDAEGTWYDDLCGDLDTLLKRSNIEYKELLSLLVTDFLNPLSGSPEERRFAIVSKPGKPVDSCKLEDLMLEYRPIDDEDIADAKIAFFDKLHRFIRLYRATGWSIYQLDVVLASFGATDIGIDELILTYKTGKLANKYTIQPEIMIILWSDISTTRYINFDSAKQDELPSVYDRFFRNRSMVNPPDPNFDDPASITGTLEMNRATILAAYNISESDLYMASDHDLDIATNIENLSGIYRKVLAYQCSKRPSYAIFKDQLDTLGLELPVGTVPEVTGGWEHLFMSLDAADYTPFSWPELKYLFRHQDTDNQYIDSDSLIQSFYEALRLELNKALNNFDLDLDPVEHPEVIDVKARLSKLTVQQYAAYFELDFSVLHYLLTEVIQIGTTPGFAIDILITNDFINSVLPITRDQSIGNLDFEDLYHTYFTIDKLALLSEELIISPDLIIFMQERHAALTTLDILDLPVLPAAEGDPDLIRAFFHYNDWIELRDRLGWKDEALFEMIHAATDTGATDNEHWKELVPDLTGWNAEDLEFLFGDGVTPSYLGALNLTFDPGTIADNDYRLAAVLLQADEIISSSRTIGLNVNTIYSTLLPILDSSLSLLLRKTAKAKYEEEQWYTIIKPLQDILRRKQRDALLSYLIARPGIIPDNNMKWNNKNDLFAYLLIDVEMESCMKTSRLKQGISSLQLFLDRIILHIEKVNSTGAMITMQEDMAAQWQTWRKWYRVWEANRKIFLYPENWIEPELRDNKSPLFKDLESYLLQDEPTNHYVEGGFRQYLQGLDAVARLEPVSAYHEYGNGKDIFHVIARTNVNPQYYYYRTFEDHEWSSWERIEVDIKSDHVVPVIFNSKFHIFWLSFVSRKSRNPMPPLSAAPPSRRWIDVVNTINGGYKDFRILPAEEDGRNVSYEVMLQWTFLQDGKWQKQQEGKQVMQMDISRYEMNSTAQDTYGSPQSSAAFQSFTQRGDITPEDFFRNRIYLLAPQRSTSPEDGIVFNLIFPGGWDESGKGCHSFRWTGDSSREPVVVKDTEYSWQVLAPYGTRFHKMKFEQDVSLGNVLRKDTTYDRVKTGHYTYSLDVFIPNTNTWYRKGAPLTILNDTPFGAFRLTGLAANRQYYEKDFSRVEERFFYEDNNHTYYVEKAAAQSVAQVAVKSLLVPGKISPASAFQSVFSNYPLVYSTGISIDAAMPSIGTASIAKSLAPDNYLFHTYYHAQIGKLIGALNTGGVSSLLQLQNQSQADTMHFAGTYLPTSLVNSRYPRNNVQFGYADPYSIYNWELFFHAPMMIAQRLSGNMQFEAAQKWYHYIFNPTSNTDINGSIISTNQRFWKFYPFYTEAGYPAQTLEELLVAIHNNNAEAVAQVKKWEKTPFNPHLIARMRILAYMKNVLMKYLDNLIAWADNLYRRDTIESINEASQLYILASNILGERPRQIPPRVKRLDYTFDELSEAGLDAFSNAMVAIESFYAPNDAPSGSSIYTTGPGVTTGTQEHKIPLHTFYFCLPPNDMLLKYWDTIADRLFKIRNCMNLDGVARQLPLYEPPIDPALLVRATAMGIDINTVLDEVYGVTMPHYRFIYIVQKANEIINDLKGLGSAILSALEKKDAEALSLLRSGQEIALLGQVRQVRIQQVNEAAAALEALYLSKENTEIRYGYYNSREYINAKEQQQQAHLLEAQIFQVIQGALQTAAGVLSAIPTFHIQGMASGSSFGGHHLSNIMQAASTAVGIKVGIENFKATQAGIMGGYDRRKDDWNFQRDTASKDLEQIDRQILAGEIRMDIAQKELNNHDLQTENALQADAFMRSKFTNTDLYNWMSTQLAATYFQVYQLAYDTARKADVCYRYELPQRNYPADGFIKFGYWDSLRKGLLGGEKLQLDVRRMETAYMDENARELELTKNISLAVFSPESILELKRTGSCTVAIPELLYDLDYPGHYMRRIKSVSLSIPCIAGPYTTVNCQLYQQSGTYRKEKVVVGSGYNDPLNFASVSSHTILATSSGQNDGGMFELNFRDERYLPFEGTGAISTWTITFPDTYRQFDYDTITDVIMHIRYTARYDGGLSTAANQNIETVFAALGSNNILHRFWSIPHEFSNEWFVYTHALEHETGEPLTFIIRPEQFPFFTEGRAITIKKWHLQLKSKRSGIGLDVEDTAAGIDLTLTDNQMGSSGTVTLSVTQAGLELTIDMSFHTGYDISDIADCYLVADYILEDV